MDGADYYMINTNGKLVKNQQQQWGFVKEETFSSNWEIQWPSKNYSCHFCRREFKSAQALGGHMNVHRRDKEKLRLLHNYSYPNPNFFFPFSPSCFTFSSNFNNSWSSIDEEKNASIGICSWNKPSTQDDEVLDHVLKKKKKINVVNLEGCSNEDLELELHL